MPIVFARGDLFSTPGVNAFAHGCNCAGAMGKGIAVAFRQRWPEMFEAYKVRCREGRFELGNVFHWRQDGVHVFNLGTQKTWRTRAELSAIDKSVAEMIRLAGEAQIDRIALPRIGAGLGGLEWPGVRDLLQTLAAPASPELLVCDDYVSGQPLEAIGTA